MAAPDSPRSSQSPPPKNGVGDLEVELEGLVNALFNLGTTVIADGTKDEGKAPEGKNVGQKVYVTSRCRLLCLNLPIA